MPVLLRGSCGETSEIGAVCGGAVSAGIAAELWRREAIPAGCATAGCVLPRTGFRGVEAAGGFRPAAATFSMIDGSSVPGCDWESAVAFVTCGTGAGSFVGGGRLSFTAVRGKRGLLGTSTGAFAASGALGSGVLRGGREGLEEVANAFPGSDASGSGLAMVGRRVLGTGAGVAARAANVATRAFDESSAGFCWLDWGSVSLFGRAFRAAAPR